MLWFLPETPKFLISQKKFEEARSVFQQVYRVNTGRPDYTYPVMMLEGEYENNNDMKILVENADLIITPLKTKLSQKFANFKDNVKTLFTQPYLKYLAITSFADFGLMARYYFKKLNQEII